MTESKELRADAATVEAYIMTMNMIPQLIDEARFPISIPEIIRPCCVTIRAEGANILGILRGFSRPPCSVTVFNKGESNEYI